MFLKRVLPFAAVSVAMFGGAIGCAPKEFISTTAPSVSIYPNAKSATTIADLDVSPNKVMGQAAGKVKNRSLLEAEALVNALRGDQSGTGADVLVGAQFHQRRVNDELTVTVVGYPARYRNFRPAPETPRNRTDIFTIETADGITIIGYNRAATNMEMDERGNLIFSRKDIPENATPATPAPAVAPQVPVVPQYAPAPVSTEEGEQ